MITYDMEQFRGVFEAAGINMGSSDFRVGKNSGFSAGRA